MYSILIADDEALERKALSSIIKDKVPEISVIEEAENGQVALDKAKKLLPDILLLDIKMPRISGIEVARQVKEFSPDCKILLLSGYTYFNYAREAVTIGIQDFLVKPVEDNELVAALQIAIKSLEKAGSQLSGNKRVEDLYHCLEREFISSVAFRQIKEPHLGDYLKALEISGEFCLGGILCEKTPPKGLSDSAEQQISTLLHAVFVNDRTIAMRMDKHIYILLFVSSYRTNLALLEQFKIFSSLLEQTFEQPFALRLGSLKSSASELFESFNEGRRMLKSPESIAMFENHGKEKQDRFSQEAETLLCDKLLQGERDNSLVLLSDLYRVLEKNSRDFEELKLRVYNLLVILNRRISKDFVFKDSLVFHYQLELYTKRTEVKAYLFDQMQEMLEMVNSYYSNASKAWKQQIHLYLSQSFQKEVNLEDLASYVGFSTSYLSRIFKQEFGMNFCSYVNHLRIEQAKKLLPLGTQSIKEIAYSLGYTDANYFARVFKKETGVNASQYQKVSEKTAEAKQ
jgi:two-component system response regulator YesN